MLARFPELAVDSFALFVNASERFLAFADLSAEGAPVAGAGEGAHAGELACRCVQSPRRLAALFVEVSRMLAEPACSFGHGVGAGKGSALLAAGVEGERLRGRSFERVGKPVERRGGLGSMG